MKHIATALILLGVTFIFACQNADKPGKEAATDTGTLQAPYAAVFYDSLQQVMDTYYDLTDGMATGNMTYIDKYGASLRQHLDSLPVNALQMDSSRLAQMKLNVSSMSAELSGMLGEKKIEERRAGFEMVSNMLYDLVKTTGLKGKTIYRQYCPMAFNDKGAYWMSRSTKLENPYFGNEMTSCVEVTDSLKY